MHFEEKTVIPVIIKKLGQVFYSSWQVKFETIYIVTYVYKIVYYKRYIDIFTFK